MNPYPRRIAAVAVTVLVALAGCKTKPPVDDASLTTQVGTRLSSDQALAGQPIQATVNGGVATLSGTAASDAARSLAADDAAQIAGIRTVINNLTVNSSAPDLAATVVAPPSAPIPTVPSKQPREVLPSHVPAHRAARFTPPAPIESAPPEPQPMPQPAPVAQSEDPAPPSAPPPPPAPVVRAYALTLPAGTTLPVRITQTLDSATTQTGDRFNGSIASDIVIDGVVAIPQGTPVTGHVDAVQEAAHYKGASLLTVSLASVNRKGDHIAVTTEPFSKEGAGRGKNTAEKVGGGAAIGAILGGIFGGIFGGGKGAAIGAAAGGGVGAGANTVTKGQQVQIPSETLIRFRTTTPITLRVSSGGSTDGRTPLAP
jgi:hypothetical protein